MTMNKQFRVVLGVVLVALAGAIGWMVLPASRAGRPAYGGKELTLWLRTYAPTSSSGRHSPQWNATDDAVRHIGTNSIPILLRMIRQKDSRAKLWLVSSQNGFLFAGPQMVVPEEGIEPPTKGL
jgi:hypothetical protein